MNHRLFSHDPKRRFDPSPTRGGARYSPRSSRGGWLGGQPARPYVTLNRIVTSVKSSPAWKKGNDAIVVVWDENDYTATPNKVLQIVDTNYRDDADGVASGQPYNHFSLLKSLEAGFGLPCLNHACDGGTSVMTDLFGGHDDE